MAILVTEIMIAKSVLTMYASDVLAKTVEINYYFLPNNFALIVIRSDFSGAGDLVKSNFGSMRP